MSFRIFGSEYKNDVFFIRLIRSIKQRIWSLPRLTFYDHNSVDVELMMLILLNLQGLFQIHNNRYSIGGFETNKDIKPLKMNQLIKCSTIL